jgi:uncharacterized protein YndB with AHSA1/START domain
VPIEKAFRVFTNSFDTWWPREFDIGQVAMAEAILEPREGGRWYERGIDGSECDWGRVLAWEPPHRVLVTWQINGDWQYDPDPEHASEIEPSGPAWKPDTQTTSGSQVADCAHRPEDMNQPFDAAHSPWGIYQWLNGAPRGRNETGPWGAPTTNTIASDACRPGRTSLPAGGPRASYRPASKPWKRREEEENE